MQNKIGSRFIDKATGDVVILKVFDKEKGIVELEPVKGCKQYQLYAGLFAFSVKSFELFYEPMKREGVVIKRTTNGRKVGRIKGSK